MVPNAKSQVRLDELNEIIDKLDEGGQAAEKLANMDAQAGLYDPAKNTTAEVNTTQAEVLGDSDLAKNMLAQADSMLAEAKNLQEQAYGLDPSLKPKATAQKAPAKKPAARKTTATKAKA